MFYFLHSNVVFFVKENKVETKSTKTVDTAFFLTNPIEDILYVTVKSIRPKMYPCGTLEGKLESFDLKIGVEKPQSFVVKTICIYLCD